MSFKKYTFECSTKIITLYHFVTVVTKISVKSFCLFSMQVGSMKQFEKSLKNYSTMSITTNVEILKYVKICEMFVIELFSFQNYHTHIKLN